MNTHLVEGMDKFLAKYKDEDKKKAPKKLKESVEKEVLTKEDIDKFFTDYDRKIRRRIRYEIKHGDYGDYDMWDAIEDELYEANPKDFTPEIKKYFKKRIWQIIDEYEGTNYAEEELDEGYKKPLNEDSILDKINKYLDSIGEAPITESKEKDEEKVADKEKETITESKKLVKKSVKVSESLNRRSVHPGNLFESLNKGFEKLYGKVEDPVLENKYSSSKSKRK